MGDTSVGYRHGDYPVTIDGTDIIRAQNFEATKTTPRQNVYQLGTENAVGQVSDADTFTGRLTVNAINNQVETALDCANLVNAMGASGADVYGPIFGITSAKVTSIQYSCRVGGFFQSTFTLEGTGTSGSTASGATATAGAPAYRAKDVSVSVDGTPAVRAQGFTVRANLRSNRLEELNNSSVVGIAYDSPTTTADIDFVESTNIAGASELTGANIVINVNSGAKTITLTDMHSTGRTYRGTVGAWATRRFSYLSAGSNTTNAGLAVS